MPVELLSESGVPAQDQLALVDHYSALRTDGDVDGILAIVTDDIQLESAMAGLVKGKADFRLYLQRQKAMGQSEPAQIVDGVAQCRGKAKLLFVPISFVAKFQVVADPTAGGGLIEKIVITRA
jgi:ketosteroid isomerase-like protein